MSSGEVSSEMADWSETRPDSDPTSVVNPSGKTVFDVLKEKHPESRCVNENAFINCEELPSFMDVDVTGGHVEWVNRKLQGGAGPGGTQLCNGASSGRLCHGIAELTWWLANNIVDWMD